MHPVLGEAGTGLMSASSGSPTTTTSQHYPEGSLAVDTMDNLIVFLITPGLSIIT